MALVSDALQTFITHVSVRSLHLEALRRLLSSLRLRQRMISTNLKRRLHRAD